MVIECVVFAFLKVVSLQKNVDMERMFYIVSCIAAVESFFIGVLIFYIKRMNVEIFMASLREKQLKYLLKVHTIRNKKLLFEKIHITKKANLGLNHHEEVQRLCMYRGKLEQLYIDLMELYFPVITYLETEYPQLGKIDILIIVLIFIGYDNQEIGAILNYTKRTIYKRRQIISRMLGLSSLQLDEYIRNLHKSVYK